MVKQFSHKSQLNGKRFILRETNMRNHRCRVLVLVHFVFGKLRLTRNLHLPAKLKSWLASMHEIMVQCLVYTVGLILASWERFVRWWAVVYFILGRSIVVSQNCFLPHTHKRDELTAIADKGECSTATMTATAEAAVATVEYLLRIEFDLNRIVSDVCWSNFQQV